MSSLTKNYWRECEVAALLGSQKAPAMSQWPTAELQVVGSQFIQDHPLLLSQLALMAIYQRAGQQSTGLAATAPAEGETQAYISPAAQQHAQFVLHQEGQAYLGDWLNAVVAQHALLPRTLLPQFLRLGEQNKKWRLAIGQIAGKRGAWLGQQNPDWSWSVAAQFDLNSSELENYWQTASLACREVLFERLRLEQPERALAFITYIWPQENANVRKLLLEKLTIHLSMADHDFLESCLDDRSKVVKDVAIDLLARLPESLLVQRMQQQLSQILLLKTGIVRKSLDVIALESISPELERDGFNPKAATVQGLGAKAQWLRDIISYVSLDWLTQHYGLDAQSFVTQILKTEWEEALIAGLTIGAIRQQQQPWLQALLTVESNKIALRRIDLQNALSPTIREQWLLNALKKAKNSTEQLTILATALRELGAWQWSPDFTLIAMCIYQHPQLQNSQSYEVERRLMPQLLDHLAVWGDARLSLQPNQYPTVVLIAWKFKLEMTAALNPPPL